MKWKERTKHNTNENWYTCRISDELQHNFSIFFASTVVAQLVGLRVRTRKLLSAEACSGRYHYRVQRSWAGSCISRAVRKSGTMVLTIDVERPSIGYGLFCGWLAGFPCWRRVVVGSGVTAGIGYLNFLFGEREKEENMCLHCDATNDLKTGCMRTTY